MSDINIYQALEDSIYDTIVAMFPDWRVIQAYGNGPEPVTPYIAIDVKRMTPSGQGVTSSALEETIDGKFLTVTVQDYIARVNLEVIGKNGTMPEVGDISTKLTSALRSPRGYDLLTENSLSVLMQPTVRRIPLKRETDTYMVWQHDYQFAYALYEKEETEDYIGFVGIDAIYTDAGREPEHIIRNHIDIDLEVPKTNSTP